MKHYILVSLIEPPSTERDNTQSWRVLLMSDLHSSKLPDGQKYRIGEAVWLLERENGVDILAKIVTAARAYHIECVVRFLSSD
jgi:hypothetical protein